MGGPATRDDQQARFVVQEFYLSPGDDIRISVYKHEELSREIKIPPDGKFFYPLVGEIDTSGMSLGDLRKSIVKGLSAGRDQVLFPGDEIRITVFRNKDFDRTVVIPSDGRIQFPLCGDIMAEGKTVREVSETIAIGLSKHIVEPQIIIDVTKDSNSGRIVNPQVSVEVKGFGGQKFFVLGEVHKPGVFHSDGITSLVEALSLAGGSTLDGKQESVLVIRNVRNPKPDLYVFNIKDFYETGRLDQNPSIQRGDVVYVPRTFISNVDRFFMHLGNIVGPIVGIGTGIRLGQVIADDSSNRDITISINPP